MPKKIDANMQQYLGRFETSAYVWRYIYPLQLFSVFVVFLNYVEQ